LKKQKEYKQMPITRFRRVCFAVLIFAVLLIIPGFLNGYWIYILSLVGVYAIAAIGLNLLLGYTGLVSLGHAGFFAIGAYGTAGMAVHLGLPFWLAIPLGSLMACFAGILIGAPALRLSGLYLAIITLGFGIIVRLVAMQTKDLTGGSVGMSVPPAALGPFQLITDYRIYCLVLITVIFMTFLAINIARSRTGRAFRAIMQSEPAAQAVGISLAQFKVLSFALSALYTGVAGGLFSYLLGFIGPENFTIHLSLMFVVMIVVGGEGSILGSFLGALFIGLLPEILRNFAFLHEIAGLHEIILGAALIFSLLFLPKGLVAIVKTMQRLAMNRKDMTS
jgi:branched-chain amino acid transport system permease protein